MRESLPIPATAVMVAMSLDGVMTPMKDGARGAERKAAGGPTANGRKARPASNKSAVRF